MNNKTLLTFSFLITHAMSSESFMQKEDNPHGKEQMVVNDYVPVGKTFIKDGMPCRYTEKVNESTDPEFQKAKLEAKWEEKIRIAKKLKAMGMNAEELSTVTGISIEELTAREIIS